MSSGYHGITLSGGSQFAWIESLRFGSELAHFPLRVCLPLPALPPSPLKEHYWMKGSWWVLGMAQGTGNGSLLEFWAPACWRHAVYLSATNHCPCPIQMMLWLWAASVAHSLAVTSVWSCFMKQVGLECMFSSGWAMCWDSHEKSIRNWNSFQSTLFALLQEQVKCVLAFHD